MKIYANEYKREPEIKVSVIVPIYNAEKHLNECIESIVNQTLKEIEIICVNDGSTDSSLALLKKWEKADERIKIINNYNHGTGFSINCGIHIAKGEYITEVDCDDFIDPDMYEYLYSISDKADIVKSGYYSFFNKDKDLPYSLVNRNCKFNPLELDYMSRYRVFGFQSSYWSAIYRRKFILKHDLMWNETPGASFQDTSIIFKTTALADKMIWTDRSFYHWRVSEPHSVTSTNYPKAVLYEYACMEQFLKENPYKALGLRAILSKMRLGTYSWNYSRIAPEDKLDFAIEAAKDLKRDIEYFDLRYYSPREVKIFKTWALNPKKFHEIATKAREQEK